MSTVAVAPPAASAGRLSMFKSLFMQVLIGLLLGILLGVADARLRGRAQASQRRLPQAHLDDRRADRVLRRRARHRRRRRPEEGRPGRRQGAGLFRGDDDRRADRSASCSPSSFGPGHGMNIDTSTLDAACAQHLRRQRAQAAGRRGGSFILNIIPTTSFDALARNDVLQVLFFAILFGVSLALVGGEGRDGHRDDRGGLDRAVQGHGPDRSRGPARRARRRRLHGRPLRRRIAQATRLSGRAVLRRRSRSSSSWCSAR